MTDDAELNALIAAYLRPDEHHARPGAALRARGPAVVPALAHAYATAGRARDRAALLVAATFHARVSAPAVALGLEALGDRARVVRDRACGLLAYAGRSEALPALRALSAHPDAATRGDAAAAVVAIESRNHHRFIDRAGEGRVTWLVNPSDAEPRTGAAGLGRGPGWWGRLWRHLTTRCSRQGRTKES